MTPAINFNSPSNNQILWQQQSETAISLTVSKLKEGENRSLNPRKLFYSILRDLGAFRHQIALEQNNPDAEGFGIKRDKKRGVGGTPLYEKYSEFGQKLLSQMKPYFKLLKDGENDYHETPVLIEGCWNGIKTIFEMQVLLPDVNKKKRNKLFLNDLQGNCAAGRYSQLAFKTVKDFKRNQTPLYKRVCLVASVQHAASINGLVYQPILNKTNILVCTSKIEIDGKMIELSQYISFLPPPNESDIYDSLKRIICPFLIKHHDEINIKKTLREISRIFEGIFLWKKGENTLITQIGFLRYLLSHAMPYYRGSAAISEWLETSLYRFHGYSQFPYPISKVWDCEALISLRLSDFMKLYKENTVLHPPILSRLKIKNSYPAFFGITFISTFLFLHAIEQLQRYYSDQNR